MASLREKIFEITYKGQANYVAESIINHQYEMQELMSCFFSDDWILCQKVSWPLTILAEKKPGMVQPYIARMVDNLQRPVHDAVVRNTLRTWQSMPIPEDLEGPIYDKCFVYMADPKYPAAIRVFAMTVCVNIAMRHPSLSGEIIAVIEDNWDHATAAWRSRGRKELKRLNGLVDY